MLKRQGNAVLRLLATLVALALFAAACGGGGDDSASDAADDDGESTTTTTTDDGGSASEDSGSDDEPDTDDSSGDSDDGDSGDSDAEDTADTVEVIEDDPEEVPVEGGTLRYVIEADVDGINPTSSALSAPGLMMANAVFDSLVVMDPDGNWHPMLAESFTPNDDFTSWTVKLRAGVEFHDGTPLNAEAIRANFSAARENNLVGLAVRPFFPSADDGGFEIVDDLTFILNPAGPDANLPTSFSAQLGYVASPAWLEASLDDPTLNQAPVGSGPFVFDARSEDSVTRFVRNENWWNGRAYLDAIEFVPVTDPNTRNELLFEGEVNAVQTSNQENILDLRETEGIQNVLDDTGEEFFVMMNSSRAPFDDIRVRRALTFATPRQNFLDLIGLGLSQPADQMFTPSSPYYVEGVVQEADDPEAAAPLVAEYCAEVPDNCTDGKVDMEFQWSGPSVVQTRIAELFEQGWGEFFNVDFQELQQDVHIQEVAVGFYDVVTWRQFGAVNPGNDQVWLLCRTIESLSLNWPRFCDPERDELLAELQLATTIEERQPILEELVRNINQSYTYVFMNHTQWDNAFAENVRGVCGHVSPDGAPMRCSTNGRTWHSNVWLAGE
ncbi:MAG: ABC transporter substrate-binding protein [Actinomycetota bacterium]